MGHSSNQPTLARTWDKVSLIVLIIPLAMLGWSLAYYPTAIFKTPPAPYILKFSVGNLFKMSAMFYGLYLVPGLILLFWRGQRFYSHRPWLGEAVLLGFAIGCAAHVVGCFLQKFLGWSYQPLSVLVCLGAGYLLVALGLSQVKFAKPEGRPPNEGTSSWVSGLMVGVILLCLFLGWEMTLRGRASSVSLMGDGYPHLINTLGTLVDGPFPDGLPFFSTFIPNVHPMAFHAMLATLKTLTPGILHIDLIRYFSVMMVPIFVLSLWGFLSQLAGNRLMGALVTLMALFVSGGGLSLRVPIVFFPWYWSVSWCLVAAVLFLLIQDKLRHPSVGLWLGILFGVGSLMHPFFALRFSFVVMLFFFLEWLRRTIYQLPLRPFFFNGLTFAAGATLIIGLWLFPLLIKYGLEETYSLEYIRENFSHIAPKAVAYVEGMQPRAFSLREIYRTTLQNAGLLPIILGMSGLGLAVWKFRKFSSAVLLSWWLAMGLIVATGFMINTYRYFEFFFFALVALSAFALGMLWARIPRRWLPFFVSVILVLEALSIRYEFFPKYQYTLRLYGSTSLTEKNIQRAEHWAPYYFKLKQEGNLDRRFGSYRGYLWSMQKKIWDIFIANKKAGKRSLD